MQRISSFIIPLLVFFIVLYGIYKKVNVYDTFVDGAKESFEMVLSMFPTLLGMILGINIFLKSSILECLFKVLEPFFSWLGVPLEIVPMALMRSISGSSSLAILNHIYQEMGPDGFLGRLGSIIQGSTDTTFYILTLYFGSVGIKKIRYALWAGLFADLVGVVASIIIVNLMF